MVRVAIFQRPQNKLFIQEMVEFVNAVVVILNWNLIMLCHFHVAEVVIHPIFSYYVKDVTEVNPTVVYAKFIKGG